MPNRPRSTGASISPIAAMGRRNFWNTTRIRRPLCWRPRWCSGIGWKRRTLGAGQFNSIHDRLVALWKELAPALPGGRIEFCSMEDAEDEMTVAYLLDTALQAGLAASMFPIDEIGWDGAKFVAPDDVENDGRQARPLTSVFK